MNSETRIDIIKRLKVENPNPTTELEFSTPFELLIAVTLSAQATDVSVNKVTRKLFKIANTPQAIYDLGVEKVREIIKSIGLFNSKAKHIVQTSKILLDKYDGQIPSNRKYLEELPGVGRKTTNIILNMVFDEPIIAVDTHIYRVANRTAMASGKTVLEVEKKLVKFIPEEYKKDAHHLLLLHGRYTCLARCPKCCNCNIKDLCEYEEKNI